MTSAYIHTQVVDHDATIVDFQNEQTNGRQKDVLNYADDNRPHIDMHRMRADSIATAFYAQ